jgi:CTP:molybdopterin cytidylyltransferase MocA
MGQPKALLPLGNSTLLAHLIHSFRASDCKVVVVSGFHADLVEPAAHEAGADVVTRNEAPARGQLSSLQTGFRAVPSEASAVLFTPVDFAGITAGLIAEVLDACRRGEPNELLFIPRFEGRRGHPVCLRRSLLEEFLSLAETATAREVIHRHRGQTVYVEASDARFLKNLNDPAQYAAFLREHS